MRIQEELSKEWARKRNRYGEPANFRDETSPHAELVAYLRNLIGGTPVELRHIGTQWTKGVVLRARLGAEGLIIELDRLGKFCESMGATGSLKVGKFDHANVVGCNFSLAQPMLHCRLICSMGLGEVESIAQSATKVEQQPFWSYDFQNPHKQLMFVQVATGTIAVVRHPMEWLNLYCTFNSGLGVEGGFFKILVWYPTEDEATAALEALLAEWGVGVNSEAVSAVRPYLKS